MSVFKTDIGWLKQSISSILGQTFSDFEFIIINDSINDSDIERVLNFYKKRDKRVILVKNKKNIGLTKALNVGLGLAKGKYIARMDADDISFPDRLGKQFNYLEAKNNIFLIGSHINFINETGKKIGEKRLPLNSQVIKKTLEKRNCLCHPLIMFRNFRMFYREKFYYAQDYDFYLRLISQGKNIVNYPETLLNFRVSENSISSNKFRQQVYFAYFAKKFYQQRILLGKDRYSEFHSHLILDNKVIIPGAEFMFIKKKLRRFLIL